MTVFNPDTLVPGFAQEFRIKCRRYGNFRIHCSDSLNTCSASKRKDNIIVAYKVIKLKYKFLYTLPVQCLFINNLFLSIHFTGHAKG